MFTVLTLAAALAALPADSGKVITAARAPQAPTLDGRLDDAVWQQAPVATAFVQQQPNPGAPASQRTEARVLYDDKAIYVGMRMHDTRPDSIASQLARRDATGIYSDWALVMIDSYHDRRTAFRFTVNPHGVKKDVYHSNDSNEDLSWDAVWDAATSVDSLGWTAEFRIPLSQLRFSAREGGELVWGINFGRDIARNDERTYWAPIPPRTERFVSYSGELHGLRGLRPPQRLEVQPYAVTRYTRAPGEADDPFHRPNDMVASMGADLKYGVTSDLTLSATLNPDFGQVEADPSEVNLTAFESFFAERRPFFTEGVDLFRFNLGQIEPSGGGERIFYSRRIGRTPQRRLPAQAFADAPETTTILAAAKLSGKTRSGWSVGFLDAVTAEEEARVFSDGQESRLTVEPLTNYAMARVSRDFAAGRSTVGAVFTAVNRRIEEGSGLDFLRDEAYVGGVDGRHRFGGGNYEINASLLASHVGGSTRAISLAQRSTARLFQRPDADHVEFDSTRTSLSGTAANLTVQKLGGGNWRWVAVGGLRTPGFESNDLGFQRLADGGMLVGELRYVQSQPGPVFRNWSVGTAGGGSWTMGGERFASAGVVRGGFQLRNLWSGDVQLIRFLPALSPTFLRGGPALYVPARNIAVLATRSDPRKPVRLEAFTALEAEDGTDGWSWIFQPEVSIRPSSRASISLAPSWSRNVSPWIYLAAPRTGDDARYVGGNLDQTTLALTTRLSYSFTPDLSLQFYAQPFISAGDFADFRQVADPRADEFEERFRPTTLSFNPDFNVKQLRSNAVLRWEYRPGSTLFLVWSQGREQRLADGTFGVGRDFGRLLGFDDEFPAPATNVLLLKLNYWLSR